MPAVNRTDRLYALVEDLRASAPRPRSARQLAARYEVSSRTIERDILALQESGVPVYAEPGRRGGYAIDKTMTLPPVNFTAAEMVAIAVALARDERTPFAAATRSALRKVLAVASAAQTARSGAAHRPGPAHSARPAPRTSRRGRRKRWTLWPSRGWRAGAAPEGGQRRHGGAVTRGPGRTRSAREKAASRWAGPQPGGVPLVIQEAITAGHVLRLDYRDRHDQVTVRDVEPVAFAATRNQWYLMAWCRLRAGQPGIPAGPDPGRGGHRCARPAAVLPATWTWTSRTP